MAIVMINLFKPARLLMAVSAAVLASFLLLAYGREVRIHTRSRRPSACVVVDLLNLYVVHVHMIRRLIELIKYLTLHWYIIIIVNSNYGI